MTTKSVKKNIAIAKPLKQGAKTTSSSSFQIGEEVVYPAHGPGKIVGVEDIQAGDKNIKAYKIYFAKINMFSFIPVDKLREEGVRKLCSKEMAHKVLETLSKPCKSNRSTWSKRVQEYEMKMYSGSIMLIAEMVRSLFGGVGDPNRSYGERVIYENAFCRVSSEIAAVLKQDIQVVEDKMISLLSETKKDDKLSKLNVQKNNTDDFED